MVAASSVVLLAALAAVTPTEILEFTGASCPACVAMEPVVRQLQDAGLPIRKIDVHQQPELARQYNITAIPAFVVVTDGREVERIVGGTSPQKLQQLYQRYAEPVVRGQTPAASLLASATKAVRSSVGADKDNNPRDARPATEVRGNRADLALAATVRIKVTDQQGRAFGTGTIIDVHEDEALVLTCGHIFRDSQGKGQILCDLFVPGAQPDIAAKLISYDLRRDVGLLSLRPGVPVTAAPVGGPGYVARTGESVFAMGCNQGADPSVIENRILAVNRYNGPPNLVVGGRPIDGRSGGGLFAADGTLIGVCNAADPELDEGLYAALGNIHSELDKSGLGFVYRRSSVPSAASSIAAAPQRRGAPLTPVPNGTTPARGPSASPVAAGGQTEPAVSAVAGQPGTPEFVYIRWTQGSEDQVYMLERPSDEFLQSLSREINRRGPHVPTASRGSVDRSPDRLVH